jgi:hypothetical protein
MTMHGTTLTRRRLAAWLAAACAAALAPGCSGAPGAATVDAPRAREALETTLERWAKGDSPADLKAGSPSVVVQDFDWEAGAKLVRFRVVDEGRFDDANLRIPVELTLKGANGRESTRRVTYVVSTSPAITVFREMF